MSKTYSKNKIERMASNDEGYIYCNRSNIYRISFSDIHEYLKRHNIYNQRNIYVGITVDHPRIVYTVSRRAIFGLITMDEEVITVGINQGAKP